MSRSSQRSRPMGTSHVEKMFSRYDVSGLVPGAPVSMPPEVSASHQDVIKVSPDRVLNGPFQHQEYILREEFARLVESIKSGGFHTALFVNIDPKQDGYYFLTAGGHQRRDAAKAAGLTEIPIFIEPPVERIVLAFRALNENTIGVNRSPVNQGHLLHQIKEEYPDLTQDDIAARIGRSRGWVNNRMIAAREGDDLQEMVAKAGGEGLRALMALRKLTREERAPVIAEFLAGRYSTDMVEGRVRELLDQRANAAPRSPRSSPAPQGTQDASAGDGHARLSPGAGIPESSARRERGLERAPVGPTLTSPEDAAHTERLESVQPFVEPTAEDSSEASRQPVAKGRAVLAREAKLKDSLSRLEAYDRLCRQEAPSEEDEAPSPVEEADLLSIGAIVEARLAKRRSPPFQ